VKTELLPFDEALRRVLDAVPSPQAEMVPLESSLGRILARDVRADRDIPPFDRATLDGYAVRVRGRLGPRRRLPVVGEVAAGVRPPRNLKEGTCVRIWTGAAVPRGAQGIVPVERAREENGGVELDGPLDQRASAGRGSRGRFGIAEQGADARRGGLVATRGERITPGRTAVLAAVGRSIVPVWAEANLAIAVTGHEVVAPDRRPGREQIRNTNDAVVAAIASSVGVREVHRLGIVEDEAPVLRRALRRGLRHDILVVTGGVSAGRLDLVPAVLAELGVRIVVHKVAMRPGKPFLFGVMEHGRGRTDRPVTGGRSGRKRRTFVFGLPGNPVSVLATAIEFLAPFLRAYRGEGNPEGAQFPVRLDQTIRRGGGLTHFVPCVVAVDPNGSLWAREVAVNGSGDFVSASRAEALLRVPGDGRARKRGSILAADAIIGVRGGNASPKSKQNSPAVRKRRRPSKEVS
jgi:molybdopterin molybdotransferase